MAPLARGGGVRRRGIPSAMQGPCPCTAEHAGMLCMPACSACRHFGGVAGSACECMGQEHVLRICVCVPAIPGCFSKTQMLWHGLICAGLRVSSQEPALPQVWGFASHRREQMNWNTKQHGTLGFCEACAEHAVGC